MLLRTCSSTLACSWLSAGFARAELKSMSTSLAVVGAAMAAVAMMVVSLLLLLLLLSVNLSLRGV
jgi:hypothetical protein